MDKMQKIELLKAWIHEAKSMVFFGGAGASTESGVPDFRSPGGIYDTAGEVRTKEHGSTEMCKLVHQRGRVIVGA